MSRIWDNALATLEDCIKPHEYELWCRPIVCTGISDDEITLQAPNAYLRTYFSLNYLPLVYDRLETELKRRPRVTFQPDGAPAASDEVEPPPALPAAPAPAPTPGLEAVEPPAGPSDVVPHYTFDTFVVGPSNQLAHAAARAVAEHPATKWNPLYIYGGVGLGKTHLLMAIANEILRRNPGWRVSYVSTERFVNESIAAIQSHTDQDFRRRYREDCDVLLVDDVQFLAGKERTQDEFFHTFNTLYHAPKQIVLTSDTMPREINDVTERLLSRFQSGLIADIQRPDLETRSAILRRKAASEHLQLPDDVALFLAERVKTSVRELEGSLIRVAAYASLRDAPLTIELVTAALGDIIGQSRTALTMESITKDVADYFHLKLADLKGARRQQSIAWPRQVAMYLCYRLLQQQTPRVSYPAVADYFGGRDHTTVLSACKKVERLRDSDPSTQSVLETIERRLTQ